MNLSNHTTLRTNQSIMKTISFGITLLLLTSSVSVLSGQSYRRLFKDGNELYDQQLYFQAIEKYEQALEKRNSSDPELLGNLADAYRNTNEMEKAATYYARAVTQRKVNEVHYLRYGKTLKALEKYDEAKRWFEKYAQEQDQVVGQHYAQTCDYAAQESRRMNEEYRLQAVSINSPASDFGPAFFRDELIFSSARPSTGARSNQTINFNQLYSARIQPGGNLDFPQSLGVDPNPQYGEGPVSFAEQANLAAYTQNDFINGVRHISTANNTTSIIIADLAPGNVFINGRPFDYNIQNGRTAYPSFTPDGSAMFFASDRDGGYGGYDIYISYRQGTGWTQPVNMGPVVNSPGDEIAPFFDGENLFFASDWHAGFGGFDLFMAKQSASRWASIENLGLPLNSSYDDYSFVFDNNRSTGYLVSNRPNGRGAEDLYQVIRAGETVMFQIINSANGSGVANATIDLSQCGLQNVTTDNRGMASVNLPQGTNCTAIVSADGYGQNNYQLNATGQQGTRTVSVPLTKGGDIYYGSVVNSNTRLPVQNVTVLATNQNTGNTVRSVTDQGGNYSLSLSAGEPYVVTFSAPGYQELNTTFTPQSGNSSLQTVPLNSSYAGGGDGPSSGGGGTPGGGSVSSGYAVQVGALSTPNLSNFQDLTSIGEVYSKSEGGLFKIRVGVFPTKAEAERAKTAVRSRGYQSAFVVAEAGGSTGSSSGGQVNPGGSNPGGNAGQVATGRYRIQLGAFRNASSFDGSSVAYLGQIVDGSRGNLTIKYLAAFNTLQEAQSALNLVKQNPGFGSAFIVEYVNGQWTKVR